jgi:hypothetical protein
MRAKVIYESMFGNTRDIAEAIGEGLSASSAVEVVEVGSADRDLGPSVHLLVIGGPTHAFGLSRTKTREDAARQLGSTPVSRDIGIREWLDNARRAFPGTSAAAFDTKIDKPVPGSAAHGAEKRLRKLGFHIAGDAQHFHVTDVSGPLVPGELDRARAWGARLGAEIASRRAVDEHDPGAAHAR